MSRITEQKLNRRKMGVVPRPTRFRLMGEQILIQSFVNKRQETRFQYAEAAISEGLASMLAVPLSIYDQVIGVLHLYTAEVHKFSPEETTFISAIAKLAAQAIHRSRLFEAFQSIAQNVNSSLDLKEVLVKLLLISVTELNVKAGSNRLLGQKRETLHLATVNGLSQEYLQKGVVKVAQSPIEQKVLQRGRPVAVTDLMEEDVFQYPKEVQREGIGSAFVLTLRVRDKTIGVMRLHSGIVRTFTPEEVNFSVVVADLGTVAIENAKFHEVLKQRLEALKEDVDGWDQFLAFS